MPGIRVTHKQARGVVYLVPIVKKPFVGQSLDTCPTCQVIHPCKTVHLWLDADGSCLVSLGVFADLYEAGMPDLMVTGEEINPPTLNFGPGVTREQIDSNNRRIVQLGQATKGTTDG
jgi:hypothetical protein